MITAFVPLEDALLDQVAGTSLGPLWCLPFATLVFGFLGLLFAQDPEVFTALGLATVFFVLAFLSAAVFAWAWQERQGARELLRWLFEQRDALALGPQIFEGRTYTLASELVQYEATIGMLAFDTQLRTRPALAPSRWFPMVATLVFGWWSLPRGPFVTARVLGTNTAGGHRRTVGTLIGQIILEQGRPRASFWRRTLALDTGDRMQVIVNSFVAVILGLLALLVLVGVVAGMIRSRLPH
jgi:hypothetical protein